MQLNTSFCVETFHNAEQGQCLADLGQNRVLVFDSVSLINDDVAPVELLEMVLLLDDHLIGGHHHIKLTGLQLHLLIHLREHKPQ